MTHAELVGLYNDARNRHLRRRDEQLSKCRRLIDLPGWCAAAVASERIREWFDGWEQHIWDTYRREMRSLSISWADGQGDPCRPSAREETA